jgi:translation elongation factor EF-Tu-like GTPase
MQLRRLFTVEDVFEIKGRGVSAIGPLDNEAPSWRIGDRVRISRQDGSMKETIISGMPMGTFKTNYCEVLLRDIAKADIQVGDEVWVESEL